MRRKTLIITISTFIGLLIVGGALYLFFVKNSTMDPFSSHSPSILNRSTLGTLPVKQASSASMTRVSDNLSAPTNSWISGLALQDEPKAVYPLPLTFQALDSEFQVGLPAIIANETVMTGGHTADIRASVVGATSFELTRFDKTSASLEYRKDTQPLGRVTIAQGSPYVFYRAIRESSLTLQGVSGVTEKNGSLSFEKGDHRYTIRTFDGASIQTSADTATITAPKQSLVTMYALANEQPDRLAEFAGNELSSVSVEHEVTETVRTEFSYKTANNQPTVFAALPYQTIDKGDSLGTHYKSTYGTMKTYSGNIFATKADRIDPAVELTLESLGAEEKEAIRSALKADTSSLEITPTDTYYGGKQLARLANLLSVAKQVQDDATAEKVQEALKNELIKRLGPDYLYYDLELRGVAGQTAAFGSQDFNDHHFHYGYFIHAATIMARYDEAFFREYKDEVNLLVADIASYENYKEFPTTRYYDAYSGHSWAAGLAPFQDGNNQESSSEAMNAWNAVASWAKKINNTQLEDTALWMLAGETATADSAWRNVDTSASYLKPYASPVASLNFGGKRTYSTFFSDASNAKLGIQLIPMSPVMQHFKKDGAKIQTKLQKQDQPGNYNVALGDYLIMYQALIEKDAALTALKAQEDAFIDDGNSRSYLLAWIYSQ